jgi:hypothetical protein
MHTAVGPPDDLAVKRLRMCLMAWSCDKLHSTHTNQVKSALCPHFRLVVRRSGPPSPPPRLKPPVGGTARCSPPMDPINGGFPLARLSTAIVGSNGATDAIALVSPSHAKCGGPQGTAASSLHPVEPRSPPPISRKRALHRHLVAGCLDSKSPWCEVLLWGARPPSITGRTESEGVQKTQTKHAATVAQCRLLSSAASDPWACLTRSQIP